jgi:MFS family permease
MDEPIISHTRLSGAAAAPRIDPDSLSRSEQRRVVFASSLGTIFEWYDFYLYATLTPFFAALFFPSDNATAGLLSAFATYAAGFLVRPFGALVFGRLGDLVGRKYTFLMTIVVMGASTFAVGLLPTYASIGMAAPILLVVLRLLQGLALGGEYGGAATYVAEHVPDRDRGYATSWIQTTATLGFFLSLLVIGICRANFDAETFRDWGWRIPFLLSLLLLVFSVYIRMRLQESPVFRAMKAGGHGSKSPLRDSFLRYPNNKFVLLALLGATAGQGVVWYTGQFYALFFLITILKVDYVTAYTLIGASLLIATPFFLVFGRLSDRIGRKKIILAGCALAVLTYVPIYNLMIQFAHPQGTFDPARGRYLDAAGDPAVAQPELLPLIALVFIQIFYVTMVYGPIAAFLVEYFPARIRYTSLSIPYHIGNGWFGGFLPLISAAIIAATGNLIAALIYPITVAIITIVVGGLFIRETRHTKIWDEVGGAVGAGQEEAERSDAGAAPAAT